MHIHVPTEMKIQMDVCHENNIRLVHHPKLNKNHVLRWDGEESIHQKQADAKASACVQLNVAPSMHRI